MNSELLSELESIAAEASRIASGVDPFTEAIESLRASVMEAGKAWSGSWLGYHSRVYYENLNPPPPGAHFDPIHGLSDRFSSNTKGNWHEYEYDGVYNAIKSVVEEDVFLNLKDIATSTMAMVGELQERLISVLTAINEQAENQYVKKLLNDTEGAKCTSPQRIAERLRPNGKFMSLDTVAISNGLQTPPHIALYALLQAMESPFNVARTLAKIAIRVRQHLEHRKSAGRTTPSGDKVFIGHGRSQSWRDLKDFLQDRLKLPWDEFNRVPIAGVTNIARLSQMLDDACIAFLVMTAEDELKDGKVHARMNVIHEAGLFQGRLGFTKAIIVLEEGCEEFSNIQGLGQLRFPAGNISAIFEEIREVLEREGLLD